MNSSKPWRRAPRSAFDSEAGGGMCQHLSGANRERSDQLHAPPGQDWLKVQADWKRPALQEQAAPGHASQRVHHGA